MSAGARCTREVGVAVLINGNGVRRFKGVGAVGSAAAAQVGGIDDC